MASNGTGGAAVAGKASSDWVVFTGKLPQDMKRKLKMVAAQTGEKQQEILADAIRQWMQAKGF